MSIQVSARVWALRDLPPTEKLVLLKMADCADDDGGNAWPSVATLGRACGNLSVRAVHKVLVKLKHRGLLQVQAPAGAWHKTVTYRVTLPDVPLNSGTRMNEGTPAPVRSWVGERQDRGIPERAGRISLSPDSYDPSLNRQYEVPGARRTAHHERPHSAIQQFRETFIKLYRQHRTGAVYRWAKADSAIVEQLLAHYGFAELVGMSEALLRMPAKMDDWVSRSDRSIAVLNHRANFLSNLVSSTTVRHPNAWSRILDHLQTKLSTWDFGKWFGTTYQIEMSADERILFVSVEDPAQARWILTHYGDQLTAAVTEYGMTLKNVQFVPQHLKNQPLSIESGDNGQSSQNLNSR